MVVASRQVVLHVVCSPLSTITLFPPRAHPLHPHPHHPHLISHLPKTAISPISASSLGPFPPFPPFRDEISPFFPLDLPFPPPLPFLAGPRAGKCDRALMSVFFPSRAVFFAVHLLLVGSRCWLLLHLAKPTHACKHLRLPIADMTCTMPGPQLQGKPLPQVLHFLPR